jgi:dipeptidyl aminopeptidase/acylaminoacyl peptidase
MLVLEDSMRKLTVLRAGCLLLVIFSFLSLTPIQVQAAVLPIDAISRPLQIMDKADIEKIAALQNPVQYDILSDISPDGKTVFVVVSKGTRYTLELLDVQTGKRAILGRDILNNEPYSEIRWQDSRTLVYLTYSYRTGYVMVKLDSLTLRATFQPLPDVSGSGDYAYSLSTTGKNLLFYRVPSYDKPLEPGANFEEVFSLRTARNFEQPRRNTNPWLARPLSQVAEEEAPVSTRKVTFYVYNVQDGSTTPVTDVPYSATAPVVAWAQNESKMALSWTEFPESQISSYIEGALSNFNMQDVLGKLAPEKNPYLKGIKLKLFNLYNLDEKAVSISAADGGNDFIGNISWSTDGKTLLAKMYTPGKYAGRENPVYLFPERTYLRFYSEKGEQLNTFVSDEIDSPENMTARFVAPDEVIISVPRGMDYRLYYYNRATGIFRPFQMPPGSSLNFVASETTRQLIFVYSSYTQHPEIFRLNWDGSSLSALTYDNTPLGRITKVRADEVSFTLANGQVRNGYLLQPADAAFPPKNVPIVVWQEGGPGVPMLNLWAANVENPYHLLPNFGFAVLIVPLSGRAGYGPAFYKALTEGDNYGRIDIDEMAEIVGQTIARGWTSQKGVGITGCSYGGIFSALSIIRHPNLYAAANPQCTGVDWFFEWQFGSRSVLAVHLLGKSPLDDPERYLETSALYNARNIRSATLLIHGTNDFLLVNTVSSFHDRIQANGTAVNIYAFLREGHGLSYPNSQLSAAQLQILWFKEYLKTSQT